MVAKTVESILSTEEQVYTIWRAAEERQALNRAFVEYCQYVVDNPSLMEVAATDMLRIERELAERYLPMMETAAAIRALLPKSTSVLREKFRAVCWSSGTSKGCGKFWKHGATHARRSRSSKPT